jgi:hypothetical protein
MGKNEGLKMGVVSNLWQKKVDSNELAAKGIHLKLKDKLKTMI